MPLLIIFVVTPIIEIALLIQVGQVIGAWWTIGLVVLTAFVGVQMLRQQGLATLTSARARLDAGDLPIAELRDGILIAVGGVLLLTPGFVTDTLGFLCLIPFTRRWLVGQIPLQFVDLSAGRPGGRPGAHHPGAGRGNGDIIDGEWVDVGDKPASDEPPRRIDREPRE